MGRHLRALGNAENRGASGIGQQAAMGACSNGDAMLMQALADATSTDTYTSWSGLLAGLVAGGSTGAARARPRLPRTPACTPAYAWASSE